MRAAKLRIPQALAGLEGTARLTAEIAGAVFGDYWKVVLVSHCNAPFSTN